MSLYLINIGLLVGVVLVLALVTLGVRRWRDIWSYYIWLRYENAVLKLEVESAKRDENRARGELQALKDRSSQENPRHLPGHAYRQQERPAQEIQPMSVEEGARKAIEETPGPFQGIIDHLESTIEDMRRMELLARSGRARLITIGRVTRLFNVATTVIALIPIGFAIYNLVTNQQRQALTFNLAAIATLIVTKGGLFLLIWILLPAAKAVPAAIAGAVAKGKYDDWRKQRVKKASGS